MRSAAGAVGTVRAVSWSPSRRLVASVVVAGVLVACTPTDGPVAAPSPTAVDASAVNAALGELAETRRVAAGQVDAELRAGVRVDPLAEALRSPSTIDASLEEVPAVAVLFEQVDPAAGDSVLTDLDGALVQARDAIASTAETADPGSWQAEFLAAQGDVVAALEAWAAASREVHALAAEHWPLWQEVVADAAVLDENRWRYRTEEEAAGTWEIEVADRLDLLATVHATLTAAAEARDAAAVQVAAADQEAANVFARRPTEQATS